MPQDQPISAVRALLAVTDALARQGLVNREDPFGSRVKGWSPHNVIDSTTTNIGVERDGSLRWHFEVSGKPHLRYRNWTEEKDNDQGETLDLHEPLHPERLLPRIRAAFRETGIEVTDARYRGHQGHWDDGVNYEVTSPHPAWLERHSAVSAELQAAGCPTLCSFELRSRRGALADPMGDLLRSAAQEMQGWATLTGYETGGQGVLLTREALETLVSLPVRTESAWIPRGDGSQRLASETSSYLRLEPGREGEVDAVVYRRLSRAQPGSYRRIALDTPTVDLRARPEVVRNAWGDAVTAWRFPEGALQRTPAFVPGQPFLVSGAMRDSLPFEEWDSQFGPAPWKQVPSPATPQPGRR